MRVLAIDTALGACSACIIQAGEPVPLAAETIPMERGHAEALMPLLDRLSAQVEGGFESLERVAVTVGPPGSLPPHAPTVLDVSRAIASARMVVDACMNLTEESVFDLGVQQIGILKRLGFAF